MAQVRSLAGPAGPEAVAQLQEENRRLAAEGLTKEQALQQRAEPMLCAVIDSLDNVTRLAVDGHPAARAMLAHFREVFEAALAASAGVEWARAMPSRELRQ